MNSLGGSPFSGPGPDAVFNNHLREGRLMLQRCRSSGRTFFYPRLFEPGTGALDLEWIEASGDGTVYAATVVRQRPENGGDYNVVLVDLAEGPRLMSRVVGIDPDAVHIGMQVKATIKAIDGEPAVVFVPAA